MESNINNATSTAQRWLILADLKNGNELTTLTMMHRFGCVDGRKRISELRRLGYRIKDRIGYNQATRKRYKIYYYEEEQADS